MSAVPSTVTLSIPLQAPRSSSFVARLFGENPAQTVRGEAEDREDGGAGG